MAEDEKPKGWDISRSHVPNLEDFLQGLYVNQFVSVEPTSAQFSVLSARVEFISAHAGGGSATSQKVSVAIAVETSNRISAISGLSVINGDLAISGRTIIAKGTEASAGLVFFGDTDTGIWQAGGLGAGRLDFAIDGVNKFNVDSAGGTIAGKLDITGSGNYLEVAGTLSVKRTAFISGNLSVLGTISSPTIDTLSNAISVLSAAWQTGFVHTAQTISTGDLTAISGLSVSLAASTVYAIDGVINYAVLSALQPIGFGATFPAMVTLVGALEAVATPGQTGTPIVGTMEEGDSGAVTLSVVPTTTSTAFVRYGIEVLTSTAGTFQLQVLASAVASGAATIRKGSWIRANKLGQP